MWSIVVFIVIPDGFCSTFYFVFWQRTNQSNQQCYFVYKINCYIQTWIMMQIQWKSHVEQHQMLYISSHTLDFVLFHLDDELLINLIMYTIFVQNIGNLTMSDKSKCIDIIPRKYGLSQSFIAHTLRNCVSMYGPSHIIILQPSERGIIRFFDCCITKFQCCLS